jgi:hypothetical protein
MKSKPYAFIAACSALLMQGCDANANPKNSDNIADRSTLASASEKKSASKPIRGRCRMDGCGWQMPIRTYLYSYNVKEGNKSYPLEFTIEEYFSGYSIHTEGNYPKENEIPNIEWGKSVEKSMFFCDKQVPTVISEAKIADDKIEYVVDYISFKHVYGYNVGLIRDYLRVCEKLNLKVEEIDPENDQFLENISNLGYDSNAWYESIQEMHSSFQKAINGFVLRVDAAFDS